MVRTFAVKFDDKRTKATDDNFDASATKSVDIEDAQTPWPTFLARKRHKLSATDLSSQLWCERQLELFLLTGKKRETAAMRAGTARHEQLELVDHEIVEVCVETAEESLALRMLSTCNLMEQLLTSGKARELWVFGVLDGQTVLRGIIDEMRIESSTLRPAVRELVLADTKTRRQRTEPSAPQKRTSAMQLSTYQWIVQQLRLGNGDFKNLFRIYEVDPTMPFTIEELRGFRDLGELAAYFGAAFRRLPPLRQSMQIVYESEGQEFARNDLPYNEVGFHYSLNDLLLWWKGERPTEIVLDCEKWKCRYCDFVGAECLQSPLSEDEIRAALLKREEVTASEGQSVAVDKEATKTSEIVSEKLESHQTCEKAASRSAEASASNSYASAAAAAMNVNDAMHQFQKLNINPGYYERSLLLSVEDEQLLSEAFMGSERDPLFSDLFVEDSRPLESTNDNCLPERRTISDIWSHSRPPASSSPSVASPTISAGLLSPDGDRPTPSPILDCSLLRPRDTSFPSAVFFHSSLSSTSIPSSSVLTETETVSSGAFDKNNNDDACAFPGVTGVLAVEKVRPRIRSRTAVKASAKSLASARFGGRASSLQDKKTSIAGVGAQIENCESDRDVGLSHCVAANVQAGGQRWAYSCYPSIFRQPSSKILPAASEIPRDRAETKNNGFSGSSRDLSTDEALLVPNHAALLEGSCESDELSCSDSFTASSPLGDSSQGDVDMDGCVSTAGLHCTESILCNVSDSCGGMPTTSETRAATVLPAAASRADLQDSSNFLAGESVTAVLNRDSSQPQLGLSMDVAEGSHAKVHRPSSSLFLVLPRRVSRGGATTLTSGFNEKMSTGRTGAANVKGKFLKPSNSRPTVTSSAHHRGRRPKISTQQSRITQFFQNRP